MTQAIAYLSFDGTCAQAMGFYERVLHAKAAMMSFGDAPPGAQMPPQAAARIMHASLALPEGGLIYGGDTPPGVAYEGVKGVSVALNFTDAAQAEAVFAALGEGGRVTMPMQATFWAKRFGMLVDRFGIPWIVNGELLPD